MTEAKQLKESGNLTAIAQRFIQCKSKINKKGTKQNATSPIQNIHG